MRVNAASTEKIRNYAIGEAKWFRMLGDLPWIETLNTWAYAKTRKQDSSETIVDLPPEREADNRYAEPRFTPCGEKQAEETSAEIALDRFRERAFSRRSR